MRKLGLLLLFAFAACRNDDFDPASKVEAVRILSTRADKPYAKPGDTVNLEILAADGRAQKPTPMGVYWVPIPCVNPPGDSYYACYPAFAQLPAHTDLTPLLHAGTTFSFTMPSDIITSHTKKNGSVDAEPDGLVVVFSIACAGHVEYTPPAKGASLNALPLACFDENHKELSPNDWVFAYSQVFAFADRPNANPIFTGLTSAGAAVDLNAGITVTHCVPPPAKSRQHCPTTAFDVVIDDASWEEDPSNLDVSGKPRHEEIRADYFITDGKMDHDTVNVFDSISGRIKDTTNQYTAPAAAGEQTLWVVVRDNRGGATWLTTPLHVQ